MKKLAVVAVMAALLGVSQLVNAMATEQVGPDTPDRPTNPQPGWPKGIEQALRHSSRVYSIWINGNENFYFKATPDDINELLDAYSKARLRDHEVKLEFGRPSVSSFDKHSFEYNVKLEVLSGIALFMMRERGAADNSRTLEPNLTIYLDEDGALLKQLKLPENVIVTSSGEFPELKAKRTLPQRKAYYGQIQFDNGEPGNGVEHGVSTQITYWEKDQADGIELAKANRDGLFKVAFSDDELAAINKGDAWLTMTTGNFTTRPAKDGDKFPVDKLNEDKAKVQVQRIPAPKYYYGRILWEDGTPPVLKNKPWSGAEISVSFAYGGSAEPDEEGYFQLYFEPEQLEKLAKRKPSKNIYIPNQEQGTSTAREFFPPELLSQDKSKAGVVKIKKPAYEQ